MFYEILILIGLTLLPFLELRASIPYGIIAFGREWWLFVLIVCVITNALLAPLLFIFLDKCMHLFLRIKWIDKLYQKIILRAQKKIHPYVEKYGVYGLAVFIGIPLPGSGVYSGALGSYFLGMEFKDFLKASILGVCIAGVLVTLVSVLGVSAFSIFLKTI